MNANWKEGKLSDLVLFQRGFDITKAEQVNGNIPIISSSGITSFHNEAKQIGPAIIIGRKGTLGSVHFYEKEYWPHDTTLWSKELKGDPKFIYYFLKTMKLEQYDVGNANPTLNRNHIHKLNISIPSLGTQQKIARILSAYDELIENNLKRIKLLEEMAQITYEEWFVRMKFPGCEQAVIHPETGLPEGWEKKCLIGLCDLTMGQSPKSEFYNDEQNGLPFHQGVKDYGFRFPSNESWSTEGSRIADKGDILFSVRAPVGRLNIAIEQMILGRGLAAIRDKQGFQSFLFYQLQKIFFAEDIIGGGAIFNSVTKNDMNRIELLVPSENILKRFNDHASEIDKSIENMFTQNQLLKEARDILLPRLMTGMIDVNTLDLPEPIEREKEVSQ